MQQTNELIEYTVYDFAWKEIDDGKLDECAVHVVFADAPSSAVDVVSALREYGVDDEMFVNYLPAEDAPKIVTDQEHSA